jgi:FixJ family two-component response regulator
LIYVKVWAATFSVNSGAGLRLDSNLTYGGANRGSNLSMHVPNTKPVVCVVDDDSGVRDGLKLLFESVGILCECFSSTKDFLQSSQMLTASCLILDIRLPGIGGLDLQQELANAQIKTPIIFVTGHGDIPMSVRAMKAGAVEFLTKPFRDQDILDAVHVAFERDRMQRNRDQEFADLASRLETLSDREREVMKFVIAGFLNKQTAAKMRVSEVTVKVHRHNLMNKLGAKSLPDLVRMADLLGVTPFKISEEAGTRP